MITRLKKIVDQAVRTPSSVFVVATLCMNVLNFTFNLILSRELTFAQYGTVTLINTLWMVAGVLITSLIQTSNHRTAYLFSREGGAAAGRFVNKARNQVLLATLLVSAVWLAAMPFLVHFFNLSSEIPLLAFTPIFIAGCIAAVEKGFLQGALAFRWLATVTILEPLSKNLFAIIFVALGLRDQSYLAIPASVVLSVIAASLFSWRVNEANKAPQSAVAAAFPYKFWIASVATTASVTAFMTLDVLLTKHFFAPAVAGQYALLSLVGNMIFFIGSLFNSLLITFVSQAQGRGKSTEPIFQRSLLAATIMSAGGALGLTLLGRWLLPLVFGPHATAILSYIPLYCFGMAAFAISTTLVAYQLARQRYHLSVIAAVFSLVLAISIALRHADIGAVVQAVAFTSFAQLAVLGAAYAWMEARASRRARQTNATGRMRILHLGFEDYHRPGSGGGAIRTHEINRRIAKHHEVTVLCSKFPGWQDRTEEGVRYVHIGYDWGYFGSILTYFAALPFAVRKLPSDLLVEDYAAPFSSCLAPVWTRRRKVAMVQWLNAKEKSRQYHLPFWIVESVGVRLNKNFIAVSSGISQQLRAQNPSAVIDIVGNGVPNHALDEPLGQLRQDILYLGRLERAQKGVDLLLDAFALIAERTDANLILVGDGPDENWVRQRIAELGLESRVILKGRINGVQKHKLLARAQVVAMPSRFETFGMVAIEAFSAGTGVVAFEIPCLNEIFPKGVGTLIKGFDVPAYAEALLRSLHTPSSEKSELLRREFAANYDWDTLAQKQQAVYERYGHDAMKEQVVAPRLAVPAGGGAS